jgi:hypothetical protein
MKKKIVTQLYYYFTLFTHLNLVCLFYLRQLISDKSAILTMITMTQVEDYIK